jgi:hypothetical protein
VSGKTKDNRIVIICTGLAILCQLTGFALTPHWALIIAETAVLGIWFLAKKTGSSVFRSINLFFMVGLAVAGLALGSKTWLMFFSVALALIAWDVDLLKLQMQDTPDDRGGSAYRQERLKACVLAVVSGLVLAFGGHLFNLKIPFIIMMVLALLAVWGFSRIWRSAENDDGKKPRA